MRNSIKYYLLIIGLCLNNILVAQVTRTTDINNIGWASFNVGLKLSPKFDIAADYQLRRDEFGLKTQQHQLRAGLQYNFNKKASFLVGYSFVQTFPYGDMENFAFSASKVNFPEHRIYQQLTLRDQIGALELTHRYRVEQRYIAIQNTLGSHHIDEWRRTNRFRYFLRFQLPFKGTTTDEKEFYLAGYNEIFINFGSKVRYNVFDQNRSALMIGYKFNKKFRIEAGPFAQMVQLGSLYYPNTANFKDSKNKMQYNLGYIVNAYFNFDLSKNRI